MNFPNNIGLKSIINKAHKIVSCNTDYEMQKKISLEIY
jgi:hypothetical protein